MVYCNRSAEKIYYENSFNDLKNNIKGTLKLLKKIINSTGKTTSSSGVDELLINNKITKDKSQIANNSMNVLLTLALPCH